MARKQTVEQSDKIYTELCMLFDLFGISYEIINGDEAVNHIMNIINRNL